jgi:acyl carrier protein
VVRNPKKKLEKGNNPDQPRENWESGLAKPREKRYLHLHKQPSCDVICPRKCPVDNNNVDLFLVQGKFDMSVNEEVFSKVQAALMDALGVDDDEVTPEATIVGDLEAESIDFLDIVFKLEKAFGIKIQTEELFPKDILTEGTYVQDGKVNSNGLSELKRRMPWADLSKFENNPRIQDFGDLLTVSDLCRYVQSKLA